MARSMGPHRRGRTRRNMALRPTLSSSELGLDMDQSLELEIGVVVL